ncbi:unnamed protein product, partial [Sphagnum balticum]
MLQRTDRKFSNSAENSSGTVAAAMLEKFAKENPKGTLGKLITILSIDGGGGEASSLSSFSLSSKAYYRQAICRLDGAERRLADYFDIVAGTSTGGVITGLITTPASQDVPTRPLFTAKEVFNSMTDMQPRCSHKPA